MSFLMKISQIRYTKDGKRVPKGTKGAKRTAEKSSNWYGIWKEHGRVVARIPLSPDKESAKAMLTDLNRKRAKGAAALTDPFEKAKLLPITQHLTDYLADLTKKGRDGEYVRGVQNTLNRVNSLCRFKCIADWEADKLEKFLDGLECSAKRKNDYRGSLVSFANWLIQKKRLGKNLFEEVQPIEKQPERLRRSLFASDLNALLTIARERPLLEAKTIRRGKNRGQQTASVKPDVCERKDQRGWEVWLMYKTAILTGLRRGELKELRVEHLTLNDQPELTLPGQYTKNGKDARLPLRIDHAKELRQWIQATGKKITDNLFTIANPRAAIDGLRRDLAASNIPYELNGRVFDWHCFRVQFSTLLTGAKVHERIRLLLMRHADRHLTDHYDDEEHHWQDMRKAVESLPPLTYHSPEDRLLESERKKADLEAMSSIRKIVPTTNFPKKKNATNPFLNNTVEYKRSRRIPQQRTQINSLVVSC